jgi:hypothetical protein
LTRRGTILHMTVRNLVPLLLALLVVSPGSRGETATGTGRAFSATAPEPLERGKPVGKGLTVGEVHTYTLKLAADQTVTILLEKEGVAAVAALFSPDGKKTGTYGTVSARGTEKISFIAEAAGTYRLTIRTLFKPTSPGRYILTFTDLHPASDREKSERASRSCREKSWLDPQNNFLVNEALGSLSQCLEAVGKRLAGSRPQAAGLAAEAEAELTYLRGRWRWGEAVSSAYRESLLQDFRAASAAAADPDAGRAAEALGLVVEDIRIKAEHCRSSNQGLGPRIVVTVETKRGTQEERGWFVFYKCGLHQDMKGFARRFPEESSPTSMEMAPSRYFFWIAAKDDAPEPPQTRQKEIVIGKGMEKHHLDLSVP